MAIPISDRPTLSRRQALPLLASPLFAAAPAPAPTGPRDQWDAIPRVVAVGDVHGDCDALQKTLELAGSLDSNGDWAGGASHVVQIGDVPARGPQTRRAMDLLMKLETQAASAGGRVHALIGNHDAMPMYRDMRTILPAEYAEFATPESDALLKELFEKESAERRATAKRPSTPAEDEFFRTRWIETHPPGFVELTRAYAPDGKYGAWIGSHNSILRINRVLYVHGGVSPTMLKSTIAKMNQTVRYELTDPIKLLPGLVTSLQGPLWYRGLAEDHSPAMATHLAAVLKTFLVDRVCFGHTVTKAAIEPRFGSRAINLDLGLSRFYGRPPACLILETAGNTVMHNGRKIPLPANTPAARAAYYAAVAAADPDPELIRTWTAGLALTK